NPIMQPAPRYQASDFPTVNRALKGDRLVAPPAAAPEAAQPADKGPALEDPSTSNASDPHAKTVSAAPGQRAPLDPELQAALNAPPLAQYDVSLSLEAHPLDDLKAAPAATTIGPGPRGDGFNIKTASLFFGNGSLGGSFESIERWQPGEEPLIIARLPDPDMKVPVVPGSDEAAKASESGESVAPKGEVNTDNQLTKSPAERLGLDAAGRAREQKGLGGRR